MQTMNSWRQTSCRCRRLRCPLPSARSCHMSIILAYRAIGIRGSTFCRNMSQLVTTVTSGRLSWQYTIIGNVSSLSAPKTRSHHNRNLTYLWMKLRNALRKLNHDIPEVYERKGNRDLVRCNKICQLSTGDTFYNSLH